MGLLSFLRRPPSTPSDAAVEPTVDGVQRARTQARQRLIGAVVLLAVSVVALPMLFESQPRSLPQDIAIVTPTREASPAVAPRPARPAPEPEIITERAEDAGRASPQAAQQAVAPASSPETDPQMAGLAVPPRQSAASRPAGDGQRAQALLDGKPTRVADAGAGGASRPEAAQAGEVKARFVVQVGAFTDPAAVREARAKVERLGLKTYTQAIDTDAGQRIRVRVGPFGSRDEADKAAGRVKSAGLPAAIYGL